MEIEGNKKIKTCSSDSVTATSLFTVQVGTSKESMVPLGAPRIPSSLHSKSHRSSLQAFIKTTHSYDVNILTTC